MKIAYNLGHLYFFEVRQVLLLYFCYFVMHVGMYGVPTARLFTYLKCERDIQE